MLKDEQAISYLLEKGRWIQPSPLPDLNEFSYLYEYVILAAGKQIPQLSEIVQCTHSEATQAYLAVENVKKRIKRETTKLETQTFNHSLAKKSLSNLMRTNADPERIDNIASKLDQLAEYIQDTKASIADLTEDLHSCERELKCIVEEAISDALDHLSLMGNSSDIFTNYLFRIYFEPNFFEQVLTAINSNSDIRLYNYRGFYFIAPQFANLDLPWWDPEGDSHKSNVDSNDEATQDDLNAAIPTYGTSWFSNEAHHNIEQLKMEYHKLAKLYHPDVSKHSNCKELFQSISQEYQTILDSFV